MSKTKRNNNKQSNGKGYNRYDPKKSSNNVCKEDRARDDFKTIAANTPEENDVSWYVADEQELENIANVSWAEAIGLPFTTHGTDTPSAGVCTVDLIPGYGISDNPNSALNIGIRNMYAINRHKNSGASNYESPEFGMYLMNMDSIYGIMIHIQRALETKGIYNAYNRYTPRLLCNAMGVDYDDMTDNWPNYIAKFNEMVDRINTFHIPATMPIFKRHTWIFSQLFGDSQNAKSQLYLYRPDGYYVMSELNVGEPAYLQYRKIEYFDEQAKPKFYKLSYWFSIIETQLDPLLMSNTFMLMNGDIIKAFDGDFFMLAKIDANVGGTIMVNFDDDARAQLMNATLMGDIVNLNIKQVVRDIDSYTIYRPVYHRPRVGGQSTVDSQLVNVYTTTSPKTFMEATRLMIPMDTLDRTTVGDDTEFVSSMSAEIATWASIYYYDSNKTVQYIRYNHWYNYALEDSTTSKQWAEHMSGLANFLALHAQFDYAPRFHLSYGVTDQSSGEIIYNGIGFLVSRLDNYTTVSAETLENINDVVPYRLWGIGK